MAIPLRSLKRNSQGFSCGDVGDVGMPGCIFLNSSENDVKVEIARNDEEGLEVEVGKDPTPPPRNST